MRLEAGVHRGAGTKMVPQTLMPPYQATCTSKIYGSIMALVNNLNIKKASAQKHSNQNMGNHVRYLLS